MYPSIAKTKKYCSRQCMGRAGKGRTRSDETKEKMSDALKEAHKKNPGPWRKDFTVSQETKEKLSVAHMGKVLTPEHIANRTKSQTGLKRSLETRMKMSLSKMGDKAPNWKGGISQKNRSERKKHMTTFEYRDWRRRVFERDDYTCQFCGERGGELHADHIKSYLKYPKLRTKLSNGRTLCKKCHMTTDTWGGRCYN